MKLIVVDDEKLALEKLTDQLMTIPFVEQIRSFDNPEHALQLAKSLEIDVAILDIEMFGMNGIELAKKLKCIQPKIKIIFLTGYSDYAVSAFKIRANGYLLKPASTEELKEELLYVQEKPTEKFSHIRIQTFGNFELFVNNRPVEFERAKAKELLAYLIIKKGSYVNGNELLSILFGDRPVTASAKSQLRNLIASLMKSLKEVGAEEIVLKRRNQIAINTNLILCDYYEFLKGNVDAINSFMGEFMSNYEWAEFVTGYLENSMSL